MLIFLMMLASFACNNSETVTTESSDSSIKAIDPTGTIGDTSQYALDSAGHDSIGRGLTR